MMMKGQYSVSVVIIICFRSPLTKPDAPAPIYVPSICVRLPILASIKSWRVNRRLPLTLSEALPTRPWCPFSAPAVHIPPGKGDVNRSRARAKHDSSRRQTETTTNAFVEPSQK